MNNDTIYMPVKVLGEECIKCPELEITRTVYYGGDKTDIIYNALKCEHYERCCCIRDSLLAREKNIAIDEEKDMGV